MSAETGFFYVPLGEEQGRGEMSDRSKGVLQQIVADRLAEQEVAS
jgi:hypothetical protein